MYAISLDCKTQLRFKCIRVFFSLDDVRFAAVKGGCSVAMQTHFSNMKTFPRNQINYKGSIPFYHGLLFDEDAYWILQFPRRDVTKCILDKLFNA